jgi:uroporphyrinogen-III decarboxylase
MNSRQRLLATLSGSTVDRPAVSFYEIGGYKIDRNDPDPFNIFNSTSWHELLDLAFNHTDLISMRPAGSTPKGNVRERFIRTEQYFKDGSRFESTRIDVAGRTLTQLIRRDPNVLTDWNIEHLLKDVDDLKAYLQLPDEVFDEQWDVSELNAAQDEIGTRGIVMVDSPDPLCLAAQLFSMDTFVMIAFTEPALFTALLDKCARYLYPKTEFTAKAFPNALWRIYGPEYATEPYLPPSLFRQYVYNYDSQMISTIKNHGGIVRIHSHGRVRNVLPMIVEMGADAIDPLEPNPQGNIELDEVRREYGKHLVLFGNIEITDIENLPPEQFRPIVEKTIRQGTTGPGRGFVLMPTASPYGRVITPSVLQNYKTMVEMVNRM